MSEQANVTLVKELYDSMSKGDLNAVGNSTTDDVEFAYQDQRRLVLQGPGAARWGAMALCGCERCRIPERLRYVNSSPRKHVVVLLHVVAIRTGGHSNQTSSTSLRSGDGRITRLLDFFDTAALVEPNRV